MVKEDNLEMLLFHTRYLKQKDYWTRKLSGQVETTDILEASKPDQANTIETDAARPPVNKEQCEIPFNDKLSGRLLNICKFSELALYIFLLSTLKTLVHRYTSKKDIIILAPILGGKATEDTINSLVLIRQYVDGTMTFKELVLNLRNPVLEAYENQDYPYEKLEEYLFPSSSASHISCWLENIHSETDIEKIKTGLSFGFSTREKNIRGYILYDPNFYRKIEIHRLADHFVLLLTRVSENINIGISNIEFLTEEEKKHLLNDLNNNKVDVSNDKTLPRRFEEQVKKSPDAVGIMCNHHQVTYIKLNQKANRLANLIRIYNLQQDPVVGILLQRSLQMVESILAVWKAGGAYIPLDTDTPVQRLQGILADSAATVLLSQTQWLVPQLQKNYKGKILLLDKQQKESQRDKENMIDLNLDIAQGSLAYVIYTSGSTGKPKGVMVQHIGMMNHIHAKIDDLQLTAKSIVAQNASHTFDISVWQFFVALTKGGKTIVYPNRLVFEPGRFISRVIEDQVSILEVVPSYLSVMLEFLNANFRHFDSLKYLLVTGETIKPRLVSQWFDKYPAVKMVNAYGPTEASDDITHFIMDKALDMKRVPIGKPVRNLNIYILDEYMNLCPPWIKGEICVSGIGVGRGYLNNPELTAEKFKRDVISHSSLASNSTSNLSINDQCPMTNDRLYKTGDLGRWLPDGSIEFFGRKDYQVKIHGFRIEPGEIENRLAKHPGIKEVVVIERTEETGDKYLCSYIVSNRENVIPELREYLSMELPDYMIPSYFVQLEKLPLTPNGKVDRKALPKPELTGGQNYVAPRNETESKLVGLWASVLNIKPDVISIDRNFFELGGHSLKATVLASRIHKELNVMVPLGEIFKAPTIRDLGAYIRNVDSIIQRDIDWNLVLMKEGLPGDNILFFIHDGSGEIEGYVEFCNHLTNNFNCWGIRADRLENLAPRNITIRELAEKYIGSMKKIQPQGPYYITGWSLGGVIAFEIALQLEAAGEIADFLGLIDAPTPQMDGNDVVIPFSLQTETNLLIQHLPGNEIEEKVKNLSDINDIWPGIVNYLEENNFSVETIKALLPGDLAQTIPGFDRADTGRLIYYLNMHRTLTGALSRYSPGGQINSRLHYFKASRSPVIIKEGWQDYCKMSIISYEIEGDHFSILKKPLVEHTVKTFESVLYEKSKK